MKKILDFLKKYDTPLTFGVILLAFGISFIFTPDKILDWLVLLGGTFIIVISLLKITVLVESHDRSVMFVLAVLKECLYIVFGIMLIILKSGFASAVCSVLGIYITVSSILHLLKVASLPKSLRSVSWTADLLLTIALIVLGLWLTFFPLWPKILVGVAMIALGIELIGRTPLDKKSDESESGVYYTDDFVDKSDK